MSKRFPLYLLLLVLMASVISCNDTETEPTIKSASVAVKTFSISENTTLLTNIDSVFFTIDLNTRQIYNVDSLPKGTDVSKLVVNITYPLVSSAELTVKNGKLMKDTVINYATNSTDSIDFTGDVSLKLISENGLENATYTVKVNVHNMAPDSLYWNSVQRRDLPSYTYPVDQKTVSYSGSVYCLIKESSQYVLSVSNDPANSKWTKAKVVFPFTPNLASFTSTDDSLYILSSDNTLYSSVDGLNWVSCNTQFKYLYGSYKSTLLGLISDNGVYKTSIYPLTAGYIPQSLQSGFPISGTSQMISIANKWSESTQSMMIGGIDENDNLIGDMWGYDGSSWGKVSDVGIPPVTGATLIPYFTYEVNSQWIATKYTTFLAVGGKNKNGDITKTVYKSVNNGVNWSKGDDLLQLPDYIQPFKDAQAVVFNSTMSSTARSASGWESYPSKELPRWFSIQSPTLTRSDSYTWETPYIYLFGGQSSEGALYNNIWRGVLNRLAFKPVF